MNKIGIEIQGKRYLAELEESSVSSEIQKQFPLSLILNRSGSNEYYNSLPKKIKTASKGTSHVQAGYIYYFAGSNAFSLNFADLNISPFEVVKIGYVDDESLIQMLSTGPKSIEVNIFLL
ncbi:cyclophilin-like fold protein [Companilactobacillus kedongensis]|uniref:cyclophilin-like fold protein n=1 Tax=Companilactobacillus kedongensis TaxID=2486004 RepID=UPI0013DE3929|nr:cyclophilin-like fold protein [Companilactobacillus kedongensis]